MMFLSLPLPSSLNKSNKKPTETDKWEREAGGLKQLMLTPESLKVKARKLQEVWGLEATQPSASHTHWASPACTPGQVSSHPSPSEHVPWNTNPSPSARLLKFLFRNNNQRGNYKFGGSFLPPHFKTLLSVIGRRDFLKPVA